MEKTTQFEMIVSNLANDFLSNALEAPQRLLPMAEKIAGEAQTISQATEPVKVSAEKLLYVSEGNIIILDQLKQAILTGDMTAVTEDELLSWLDPQKISQVNHSQALLARYETSIQQNVDRGVDLAEMYYQNYFIEYVTGLMFISVIKNLLERKELLSNLKTEVSGDDRSGAVPYGIFNTVANNFKKELVRQYYNYQTILKIKAMDDKDSEQS